MTLPKKIEVCPIVDAVVEIRFTTGIFANAVFGLIYNQLREDFPHAEKLPILQIPEQIRESDPGLKHKPHYMLVGEGFSVQVGPDVLAVNCATPYRGWTQFSKVIFNVLEKIEALKIINEVSRLGIRYTNFFKLNDIFDKINLDISLNNEQLEYKNTLFRTEINKEGFANVLQIANSAEMNKEGTLYKGSIVDIDTSKEYNGDAFLKCFKDEIERGHEVEKSIFFSLLTPDFLKELKPIF